MKKKLAILLAGVLVFSSLAGCGNNKDTTTDPESSTESTADSKETEASKATENMANGELYNVIMQWPTFGDTPVGMADVVAAVNEIIEPEIGVTLTLEPVDVYSLGNETALTISSGEQLDLCISLFRGVGSLVNTGSIIPIDDLYEEYGQDIEEACGNAIAGGYYGGTMYAVPIAYIDGTSYGYICRTDMIEKYDIHVEEEKVYTLEEIEEIFKVIKEGEGDSFYLVAGTQNNIFQYSYPYDVLGAGTSSGVLMLGDTFDSTTIVNLFETDEYKEFAERMYRWAQAGYISPDASTSTETANDLVKAGNYLGWFFDLGSNPGPTAEEASTGRDLTVLKTVEGFSATNMFQSLLWSIPTTCKNPEKTMQFLNYLYKDSRISTLLQFGIEGVSYEVVEQDENGTVIKLPEGQDTSTVPYWQALGIYGNRLDWPVLEPKTTDSNKKDKEWSETITNLSPALGYCFVTENVATELSAVSSVVSQYHSMFNTGAVDPAQALPEFINALNSANIGKVIEENQRQLDEWLASQE